MSVRSIFKGVAGWFGGGRKQASRPGARSTTLTVEGLERRVVPVVPGINVQAVHAVEAALQTQFSADVDQLVGAAIRSETRSRTLLGRTIAQDLVRLYSDTHAHALVPAFNDFGALVQAMSVENALVHKLPNIGKSLSSESQVIAALAKVDHDMGLTIAFESFVARQATPASTGTLPQGPTSSLPAVADPGKGSLPLNTSAFWQQYQQVFGQNYMKQYQAGVALKNTDPGVLLQQIMSNTSGRQSLLNQLYQKSGGFGGA